MGECVYVCGSVSRWLAGSERVRCCWCVSDRKWKREGVAGFSGQSSV